MDTKTQPELLPCPFCGAGADVNPAGMNDPYDEDYVQCSNPDCVLYVDFSATVEQWNTRAGLAARSPRDEEAVEEAVEYFSEYLSVQPMNIALAKSSPFYSHLRTLLDHASKSPHPVERGEG